MTPPGATCLVQHGSWPLPKRTREDFHPPRPPPPLRMRAGATWPSLQRGRAQGFELANQLSGSRSRASSPPSPSRFVLGSGLHVSVFGYVRPPQGWENRAVEKQPRGTLPGWGAAEREEPLCKSQGALNSSELGLSHALLPASVQPVSPLCTLVICFRWTMLLLNCNLEVSLPLLEVQQAKSPRGPSWEL